MPSPSLLLTLVCSSPPKLPSSTAQKSVCSTPPILDSTVRHTLLSLCKQISWAAHADQIGSHAPLGPWRSGQASCHASLQLRRRRRAHPCGTRNHAQQGGARLRRGSARPAWGGATPPPPRIVSSCSASAIFQHERHPVRPRLHIPLHLLRVHPAAARERRYSWSAAWSYPATRRNTAGIVTGAARGGPPLRES